MRKMGGSVGGRVHGCMRKEGNGKKEVDLGRGRWEKKDRRRYGGLEEK